MLFLSIFILFTILMEPIFWTSRGIKFMIMKKILIGLLILPGIFLLGQSASAQTLTFVNAPGSPDACTVNPRAPEAADLNHDGIIDLIQGNAYTGLLYIWLGVGNGSFVNAPGSPMSSGNGPISTAIADYNSDGIPDLAIANYNDGTMSIYIGAGNGTFTNAPGSPYTTGTFSYYIVTADFNGDGKLDLVEVNQGANNAFVFLGNGNGTFTVAPGSPFATGASPYCVVTTDFNGDGKSDLAIVNGGSNNVNILLGNGNGTFTPSAGSPVAVGSFPRLAAVNDFNGDGKKDLAITNPNSNNVSILLGDGTGSFSNAPGSPLSVGTFPYSVNTADFNYDGKTDIAVTQALNNNVAVYYGSGTGTFSQAPGSPYAAGNDAQSMCIADFNGDGAPDLAIGNYGGSSTTILINNLVNVTPTSVFTLSAGNACVGNVISFTNVSTGNPTSYSWDFGDATSSTSIDPTHLYGSAGTYTVSLTATNGGGSNTSQQVVTIYPIPTVIVNTSSSVCPGGSISMTATGANSYSWSPPGGLSAVTGSPVSATVFSNTTYTVIGISSQGCPDTIPVTLSVLPLPTVTVSPPDSVCPGTPVILTANGASTYSWFPGTFLNITNGATVTSTATASTTYTVTGTGANGCTNTATTNVHIFSTPILLITGHDTICLGTPSLLSASGASTYSWAPATGLNTTSGNSVLADPDSSMTYTLTGTSAQGCSSSITQNIFVSTSSKALFSVAEGCGGIILITQQSQAATSYHWNFGDGQSSVSPVPSHSFTSVGLYTILLVTDPGSSCHDSVQHLIYIDNLGTSPMIPNVFTPNGDGANDLFALSGLNTCATYSLQIFDRWGVKLFDTYQPGSDFWDGRDKTGEAVVSGVYFYILSGSGNSWKGAVSLIR